MYCDAQKIRRHRARCRTTDLSFSSRTCMNFYLKLANLLRIEVLSALFLHMRTILLLLLAFLYIVCVCVCVWRQPTYTPIKHLKNIVSNTRTHIKFTHSLLHFICCFWRWGFLPCAHEPFSSILEHIKEFVTLKIGDTFLLYLTVKKDRKIYFASEKHDRKNMCARGDTNITVKSLCVQWHSGKTFSLYIHVLYILKCARLCHISCNLFFHTLKWNVINNKCV